MFVNGNLAVSGILTAGGKTIITGNHIRTGSMSVTSVLPTSQTVVGMPGLPSLPAPMPGILNNIPVGVLAEGINTPAEALSDGANLLSENLVALRKLETSLQSAEEELDKWNDLESEIGSRLGALELKYGIE